MIEAQGYAASALVTSGRMVFRCDLKNTFDERQVQRLERRKPMEPRRAWWLHSIVCSFGVQRAFGLTIVTFQNPMCIWLFSVRGAFGLTIVAFQRPRCIWTYYSNVSASEVHLDLLYQRFSDRGESPKKIERRWGFIDNSQK